MDTLPPGPPSHFGNQERQVLALPLTQNQVDSYDSPPKHTHRVLDMLTFTRGHLVGQPARSHGQGPTTLCTLECPAGSW